MQASADYSVTDSKDTNVLRSINMPHTRLRLPAANDLSGAQISTRRVMTKQAGRDRTPERTVSDAMGPTEMNTYRSSSVAMTKRPNTKVFTSHKQVSHEGRLDESRKLKTSLGRAEKSVSRFNERVPSFSQAKSHILAKIVSK